MQGKNEFEGRLFCDINIMELIGEDHLLVRLDDALDLDWIREATRGYYSHTGRPSVDPVALVKMMLIGYLYGIPSERRLAEEVRLNIAYRWFSGYNLDEETPNHSVFSKARARFGRDLFLLVFKEVLSRCAEAGLLKGDALLVDCTIIDADASMKSLVELSGSPEEYWRKLDEEEETKSSRGRKPGGGSEDRLGKHFQGEKADPEKMGKRRTKKSASYLNRKSTSDPDATVYFQPGRGVSLAYKVHVAADTSGIITAVAATPSAVHETSKLPELLDSHEESLPLPPAIAADSKYGTDEALIFLQEEKGMKTAIPLPGDFKKGKRFPREQFTYDEDSDSYTCPAGKTLKRKTISTKKKIVIYRGNPEDCLSCALRHKCMGKTAKARHLARPYGKVRENAEEFKCSDKGMELLAARKTVLEGLFGEAKRCHGLRRAKQRGVEKVEVQALLIATALNIKRLLKGLEQTTGGAKSIIASSLTGFVDHLLRALSSPKWRLILVQCHFQ
ncbi:IS1182 family transposase [Patescibacteria group bacterium]|nr:IS1182 family transposase [Patescibacteria group bacterium]